MTNDVNARAVPVYGGFQGELRKVHRAAWEPVCVAGIPQVYDTAEAAEVAAWRALRAHLCGEIVGSGDRVSLARAEAEFARVSPGLGRRMFTVERR